MTMTVQATIDAYNAFINSIPTPVSDGPTEGHFEWHNEVGVVPDCGYCAAIDALNTEAAELKQAGVSDVVLDEALSRLDALWDATPDTWPHVYTIAFNRPDGRRGSLERRDRSRLDWLTRELLRFGATDIEITDDFGRDLTFEIPAVRG